MEPLSLAVAGLGAVVSLFGDDKAAEAEKRAANAEKKDAKRQYTYTVETNATYRSMADAAYETKKSEAAAYESYAKDSNAAAKAYTSQINGLTQAYTDAQNKGVEAQRQQVESEYQQSVLNNLRDRRSNIRNALMTASAIINTSANSGALYSSGKEAGVGDVTAQLQRANLGAFQNLGILDQLKAANELYAIALTEANKTKAEMTTAENLYKFEQQTRENQYQVDKLNLEVAGAEKNTDLTKQLYDIQDKSAKSTSIKNVKTAGAKSDQAQGQAISSIGSKLTSFGFNMFS